MSGAADAAEHNAYDYNTGQGQVSLEEDEYNIPPISCSELLKTSSLVNRSLLVTQPRLTGWLLAEDIFTRWTPLHHVYFQVANFLLLLYCLFFFMSKKEVAGRLVLSLYSTFMILWSVFVLKSLDLIAWNACIVVVNLGAVFVKLLTSGCCGKGYGCCRRGFPKELEQVYRKLFDPLHVNRRQFGKILSCKRNTRQLHPGEHYAMEKSTRVDSLALLLSGRLLVSQQGRPLHIILPHQFVDSPEYFGVSTDELFQVTITAVEDSKVLVWHRDKLRLTIMTDDFLREMFDHIIGRDVVRKLIQVSDSVSITNGYYISSSGSSSKDIVHHHNETNNHHHHYTNSSEHDPMLDHQTIDDNGIIDSNFETNDGLREVMSSSPKEMVVPRIKYFANEIWSLTKIAEEETPV